MQDWKRTFRAVFVANLVTAIGMMSFLPFFPVHLAELGLSDPDQIARWTGLCAGAAPLAAALMSPFWGALGDRVGRRAMLVRSMIAIALFVGAMAFARTPTELLALRLGQGVFSGFIAPSMALASLAAPPNAQGRVTGNLQAALSAGAILGPLVGAASSSQWGARTTYLGVACAALISVLIVLAFAREDPSTRRLSEGSAFRAGLRGWSGFGEYWRRAGMRSTLILLFCVHFGFGAVVPLLHLYVADVVGPEADVDASTGLLFSALAVVMLIATPIWGRWGDRIGHSRALVASMVGTSVALFLHAAVTGYAGLIVAHVALGLALAGTNPAAFGAAADVTTPDERGNAFGLVFSARALARSVSAMIGGALAAWVGLQGLFVLAGGLILVATLAQRRRGVPVLEAETELSTIPGGLGAGEPQHVVSSRPGPEEGRDPR